MFFALLNYFSLLRDLPGMCGTEENNETMHIITFLELSSGKKSTICCPLLKEVYSAGCNNSYFSK